MPSSLLVRQSHQLSPSIVGYRGRGVLEGKEGRWISFVPLHLASGQVFLACSLWGFGNTTPNMENTLPTVTSLSPSLLGPGEFPAFLLHSKDILLH